MFQLKSHDLCSSEPIKAGTSIIFLCPDTNVTFTIKGWLGFSLPRFRNIILLEMVKRKLYHSLVPSTALNLLGLACHCSQLSICKRIMIPNSFFPSKHCGLSPFVLFGGGKCFINFLAFCMPA